MLLQEEDKPAFREWLLPKLATISDAEATVLADFVVVLLSAHGPKEEVKRACAEELSDFLHEDTKAFVDKVVAVIEQKNWASDLESISRTRPPSISRPSSTASTDAQSQLPVNSIEIDPQSFGNQKNVPTRPLADRVTGPASSLQQNETSNPQDFKQNKNKKRKLYEWESGHSTNGINKNLDYRAGDERPRKQTVSRVGGHTHGVLAMGSSSMPNAASSFSNSFAALPPVTTFPAGDINGQFDVFAIMSSMMNINALDGRSPNQLLNPPLHSYSAAQSFITGAKASCPDYETKGFCLLGTICPYQHGDAVVVPAVPEYDPNQSFLAGPPSARGYRTSGRGSNRHSHTTSRHSTWNHARETSLNEKPPEQDDQTLVVEQIPLERFGEADVRDFFSQFGKILDVRMQAYKRIAIVRFSNPIAARRAYETPQMVFNNKCVKIHWYSPEQLPRRLGTNGVRVSQPTDKDIPEMYREHDDMVDLEAFNRQQEDFQTIFEERCRKIKRLTLESERIAQQIRTKDEEADTLRLEMVELARSKGIETINKRFQGGALGDGPLSSDLARLQAKAASLFAQAGNHANLQNGGSGVRYPSWRGTYWGRAWGSGRGRGNRRHAGVRRLDNRPKCIGIAGVEPGSSKDMRLREFLDEFDGCTNIEHQAGGSDVLVAGFEQRYQAEIFLDEIHRVPSVEMSDLSWIPSNHSGGSQHSEPYVLYGDTGDEASIGDEQENRAVIKVEEQADVDFDIADDADQWL